MNRREFLILLGWMLASTRLQGPALARSREKILILGAGMAGLTAAQTLHHQGCQVQVLEGRQRLGGRIWTSGQWPDAPVDLGASWIHGVKGNPLTALAAQLKAETVLTRYESYVTYGPAGQPLSKSQEDELERLRLRVEAVIQKAQDRDPDQSLQAALEAGLPWSALSAQDRQRVDFLINGNIEQEVAGSSRELSVQWFDDDLAYKGDDALFLKGYQVLIQHLARGIDVALGQKVLQVDWSGPGVRVTTDQATHTADRLLVTLPLGVLKTGEVRFLPELPHEKRTAIRALGMGVLNKCYLRFDRVFWPADVDWLEKIPTVRGEWTEWLSLKRAANLPILLGFNAADKGREIEGWSNQQIVASAMQTLRQIYGRGIPEPVDSQITRWASDSFARGSYSFNALGSTPQMRDQLAQPLNHKLYFAGEATHRQYFSTVHGAYLSGLRAAQQITAAR